MFLVCVAAPNLMLIELLHTVSFIALLLGAFLLVVFGLALFLENNSIIDIVYGPLFVIALWSLALFWEHWSDRQWLLIVLITLWGLRLGLRILRKNWRKPEDFRYHAWREAWTKRGMLYFFFRSLTQIYLLQGMVVLIVLAPVLLTFSQAQAPLMWFNYFGAGLWLIGFFFEAVGDWQLDRFIRNPDNQGKIMTSGLWRYTRHPNYFGESTMWWGIFLLVLGLPLSPLALVSPLLITFLLLKVSGIPMLEARFAGRPDWEEYKRKTSAFLPWFPKKI